jgi:ABC-type transport system substrate-binding protein
LFALVDQTLLEVDPVEREKVLNSTYRRLRDEAYYISPGYMNIPWGVGPRIKTWDPYPLALYVSALHTITLE